MPSAGHTSPLMAASPISTNRSPRKPIYSDMHSWSSLATVFDENSYNATVLLLPSSTSENDLDDRLAEEAQSLGLPALPGASDIDGITSSLSNLTAVSDSIPQNSVQSQSSAPISRASSVHRPATRPSNTSERSPSHSHSTSPPFTSEYDKKRNSPLRRGFRKMAGLRKRRSAALASPTLTSISSDPETSTSDNASVDMKSPLSVKSSKSSWSQPLSAPKFDYEQPIPVDDEALKRSIECKDLLNLRMAQLDEKARFLTFQTSMLAQLRSQREKIKAQRRADHAKILAEQSKKVGLVGRSWFEIRPCGLQKSRQRVSSEQHSEQIGPE